MGEARFSERATMKHRWFLLALVAVIVAGASLTKLWWPKLPWHSQHRRDVVLTTERPWPVGEARECQFAETVNADSCTLPNNHEMAAFQYMVAVDFDQRLEFNNGWAIAVTCRLDSFEHATCKQYAQERR
jgi:hypothetical protein